MTHLFEDFKTSSDQDWIEKISQDLKGKTAEEISKKRPIEGIDLKVFYSKNDVIEPIILHKEGGWEISNEMEYVGHVIADPISYLVSTGNWVESQHEDFHTFCEIVKSETVEKNIGVNAALYQLSGASATTELSCTLGHLNEYFHLLKTKGLLNSDVLSKLSIKVAIGRDYFMEIAKLRALRILVENLSRAYDLNSALPFQIYAETSKMAFSSKDPDTNILRTTTACMSAVIGGCDKVIVLPHDAMGKGNHPFGNRIAKNLQLMLLHEGHLNKVVDAGSGSYYIEALTKTLSEEAWLKFRESENEGGLVKSFENGKLQKTIKAEAGKRIDEFKSGKDVFIGINKFQNDDHALKRETELPLNGAFEALKPLILEDNL